MRGLSQRRPDNGCARGRQQEAGLGSDTCFLLNGRDLDFTVDEAEGLVLAVARGELEGGGDRRSD